MFINNNKLNVHIWRYHKKSDPDHVPMYISCVNNGTSGFQLDYLLRERKAYDTETILIKKDKHIYAEKFHITKKRQKNDFINYLKALLDSNHYFPDLRKPFIHQTFRINVKDNKFPSYENWIIFRTNQHHEQIINDDTYNAELAYFKIYKAKEWISSNSKNEKRYFQSMSTSEGLLEIPLGWDSTMFHYTKYDHDFSIFLHNNGMMYIPCIQNYYILMYTTICDVDKYDYSIEDGHNSLIDQNHGAFDRLQQHYHLLSTKIFDTAMDVCLFRLFKQMNYILKYGEFQFRENETFNRWGGESVDYERKYAPRYVHTVRKGVDRLFSDITRKRLPTITELILKIEAEELKQYNETAPIPTSINAAQTMNQTLHIPTEINNNVTSISDIVNSSRGSCSSSISSSSMNNSTNTSIETTTVITNNNNNEIELTKIRVKKLIMDRLLPKINSFVKSSSSSQKDKKIKSDILKVVHQFRLENLEKITNDSKSSRRKTEFLTLIDLTQEDDVENENKNKKMKRT
jgi:hypothetical protein